MKLFIKLTVLVMMMILFNHCDSIPSEFDKTKWRIDSLGCNGYRMQVSKNLIQTKCLLNESETFITNNLGIPNEEYTSNEYEILKYYIIGDIYCRGFSDSIMKNSDFKNNAATSFLMVKLKNGKVVAATISLA